MSVHCSLKWIINLTVCHITTFKLYLLIVFPLIIQFFHTIIVLCSPRLLYPPPTTVHLLSLQMLQLTNLMFDKQSPSLFHTTNR